MEKLKISTLALAAAIAFGIAGLNSAQERTLVSDFRLSVSVSPFTELAFRYGVTFTDGKLTAKNVEELQRMFAGYGGNEVYARIATTQKYRTGFGDHSMERALERAGLAKKLGLPLNPELGLFNVYGDIRCQPAPDFSDYPEIKLPGAWTSLKLEQMLPILRQYGAAAARQILSTGAKVRIWDLGNEVEFGVAGVAVQPMPGSCDDTAGGPGWYKAPDAVDSAIGKMSMGKLMWMTEAARIEWLQAHMWPHEARMLAAVAEGVRSVDPQARFSTHISGVSSVLPGQAVAFYKAMKAGGFSPDELAVYSSVPYLPMSVIIIAAGFFSDWLVRRGWAERDVRRWFIIVGLAIGCLIVPAGLVSSKLAAVWLLTISLCGLGICSPNTWTLTQAVCEKKIVGSVSGIQNFGGNLGGIIAPALTGYLAHVTNSFVVAFAVAGGVLVIGMLAYAFLIREDVTVAEARP